MSACLTFDNLVNLLETYRGRDQIVRLLNYVLYISSSSAGRLRLVNIEKKLAIFADQLSTLRVMTRLFDDLAMLKWSSTYGLGSKDPDHWCRMIQVVQNIADQSYYPLEHIAWARDVGILKGASDKLWGAGSILWVISLSMGILSAMRKLFLLREEEISLRKSEKPKDLADQIDRDGCSQSSSKPEEEDTSCCSFIHKLNLIKERRKHLLIGLCENSADIINGIHWSPKGYLWATKLPQAWVGVFGTISTLCQLYKTINPLTKK